MSTEEAKVFLSKREIPRLFESLMTGLMFHRPTDHIQYLIDCLSKVKEQGLKNITWNSFVDIRRTKTPLPPITPPENGRRRPRSRQKSTSPTERRNQSAELKTSPLPPITTQKLSLPDVPVVFMMGGPGSGKQTQVEHLIKRYNGWVHLSMGDLLRDQISKTGSSEDKWNMITDFMSKGELAPEDVTIELLVHSLRKHKNAKGFIIEGYPRTMKQVEDYERLVGRVDLLFLLDCEEYYCTQRLLRRGADQGRPDDNIHAIARRLAAFKENTLPVAKYYEDKGCLVVLEGDRDEKEIAYDLANQFDSAFFGKKSKKQLASAPKQISVPLEKEATKDVTDTACVDPPQAILPTITSKDKGHKPGLPTCPIIFVAGGPGSGKGTQCAKISARYSGVVHLSVGDLLRKEITNKGTAEDKWKMAGQLVQKGEMAPQDLTSEVLITAMKKHEDAKAFIVEGYPRDVLQVDQFNEQIGGLNFVILLDCEEYYMQSRLVDRKKATDRDDDNLNAVATRMNYFKNNTLPIMKLYDDDGKLVVVHGDRDIDEVFYDICVVLDFAFYGKRPDISAAKPRDPVTEEIIEPSIVATSTRRTGDAIANPYHTDTLDKAASEGTGTVA